MSKKIDEIQGIVREIGQNIKKKRQESGLTLKALSEKSGISSSMISKIENCQTCPPISTYGRIASALKVSLGDIIQNNANLSSSISIVRSNERNVISHGPYVGSPLAFRRKDKKMEPFLLSYPVNSHHHSLNQHEYEEMLFVIEGVIEFRYGDDKYILEEGDCAYFSGKIPHAGRALSKAGATALVVQSRD